MVSSTWLHPGNRRTRRRNEGRILTIFSEHGVVRLPPVTFTIDVENPDGWEDPRPRYPAMTRRLLEVLQRYDIFGTFFIEDSVAARSPALVREIAQGGHEIASHS